jgi:hypothetical protein
MPLPLYGGGIKILFLKNKTIKKNNRWKKKSNSPLYSPQDVDKG